MTRGFTLVELLVSVALGAVLTWVLWQLLGASQRDAVATERRLAGVSAVQRVSQHLEADLSRLCPAGESGGVEVLARGRGVRFFASSATRTEVEKNGAPRLGSITYMLYEKEHRLMRAAGAAPAVAVPGVVLADLVFERTRSYAAPAIESGDLEAADCLLVRATWAPPEDLAAGRPTRPEECVSLGLAFALPRLSDAERFPFWVTGPMARQTVE